MVIKTASPGVFIKETDLTRGTSDAITQNVGVVCGPFQKGPVDELTYVTTEVEFQNIFGGPTDENYEYWWSVNNFLEYSGTCYVVRCDDEMGDAVDAGLVTGVHDQKMRNATDAFEYFPGAQVPINSNDYTQTQNTQSKIYVKNEDEYFTKYNGLLPNAGTFFSRTPGKWANGIAVAVIDRGADYQITLKTSDPFLTTDRGIIVNGGNANSTDYTGTIDGGIEPEIFSKTANTIFSPETRLVKPIYDTNILPGTSVARYLKCVLSEDSEFDNVGVLNITDPGNGFLASNGTTTGTKTSVATTTDGDGTGMMLDLTIANGAVSEYEFDFGDSDGSHTGYKKGDLIYVASDTGVEDDRAIFVVESITGEEGTVISLGLNKGVIVRVENGVATIALASKDGEYEDIEDSLDIVDINRDGQIIATADEVYVMGDFTFYSKSGNQIVNLNFEPKTYTRNEGMTWYWPNRPFDGEKVFDGKVAQDIAGGILIDENGENVTLQGPAKVVGAVGDIILWNDRTEQWVTDYQPKADDFVFDGTFTEGLENPIPYQVLRSSDWYSQQIAYEGIPWRQFADRPKTSANAQDLGIEDDEMHMIVYDATGDATGKKGSSIDQYLLCSKLRGAVTIEGSNNYYKDLINNTSRFLFSNLPLNTIKSGTLNDGRVDPDTSVSTGLKCAFLQPRYGAVDLRYVGDYASGAMVDVPYIILGGEDQLTASLGEVQAGYNKITEENVADLDYIIQGPAYDSAHFAELGQQGVAMSENDKTAAAVGKANFLISLGERLQTAMVLISPPRNAALYEQRDRQFDLDDSTRVYNNGSITKKIVEWADQIASSSYAVMDTGYKYMYDRFRDKYAYIPLNSDIAGTMTRTSLVSEPFFSPAGMSRGQILNVVKLGFDPSKEQRDVLFSSRVNPIATFPGEGTVLYGDKTALAYTSAFSRINVRRLFIYIEREIQKISRNVLFEFNDVPTRTNFKNNCNPFLRDVQSKRGMVDFLVVCDDSNNTPEVVDRNEFVADFYIKPNRSINFVQLNFVATKSGVSFSEAIALNRRFSSLG